MTDVLPYRLSIAPNLEAFRPELEYCCDFLDRCHYVKRTADATAVLHYGDNAPAGAIAVPAQIFPDGVRLDHDGIHPNHERLESLLAGCTGAARDYDALALIFCLLSRLEERGSKNSDRYGRFATPAPAVGRYVVPGADSAACDLAAQLTGDPTPQNRTRYQVLLTHDADRLRGYHRPFQPLRPILGDLVKRRDFAAGATRTRDAYFSGEPWRSVRMLMDMSEARGMRSRFYFMGPTERSVDSPYAVTMAGLLRKVTDSIQTRGHIVGFHPGQGTATDAAEWSRQREGLEAAIGAQVREGRQHGLGYDAVMTPEIWNAAGMDLDTTLGFPEITGFRSGTCRRFTAYSLRRRKPLRLEQLSTPIMDFGLIGGKYRDLSVFDALAECKAAAATCRSFGGTLVVLFHTGQTSQPLRGFYEQLLETVT